MFLNNFIKLIVFASIWFCSLLLYSANIDMGLSYSKNISEKKGIDISYKFEPSKQIDLTFEGGFKYFKDDNETTSDNGFISTGYDTAVSDKWHFWLFEKISYDRLREINYENHLGFGVKYVFVSTNTSKIDFSTGFLYDRTEYEDGNVKNKIRMSNRFRYNLKPADKMGIYFVAFYQPDIADFKDYIITSNFTVTYILSERLSIKFKVEDSYRSYALTDYYNDLYTNLIFSFSF